MQFQWCLDSKRPSGPAFTKDQIKWYYNIADLNTCTKYGGRYENFNIRNKYILESVQQHATGPELTSKIIQIHDIRFTLKMSPAERAKLLNVNQQTTDMHMLQNITVDFNF